MKETEKQSRQTDRQRQINREETAESSQVTGVVSETSHPSFSVSFPWGLPLLQGHLCIQGNQTDREVIEKQKFRKPQETSVRFPSFDKENQRPKAVGRPHCSPKLTQNLERGVSLQCMNHWGVRALCAPIHLTK